MENNITTEDQLAKMDMPALSALWHDLRIQRTNLVRVTRPVPADMARQLKLVKAEWLRRVSLG